MSTGVAEKTQKTIGGIRRKFAPWNDPQAVPLIRYQNVTKRFGEFTAVDNLSLDIYEREFFALLGPSGCGKTTLMRMLAGFEDPTEGQITLAGQDLVGTPPYKRQTNMMFQSYALFPHMSVWDNIAFGLRQDRMEKGAVNARVEEMLKLVKLETFAKRKPHQLSGGQRQRVALARSLAKRPKVLLLDEPLGALDKKLREETQFELMDIQMELGMTFLIVTHDQEEAMTVADRIAVMNHGKLVQVDQPAVIYEHPNSRYVADFVGDVNILDATVETVEPGMVTVRPAAAPDRRFRIAQDCAVKPGDSVAIALRPEKMRVELDPPGDSSVNCLQGEIWDIGYLGDLSIYHVELPGGSRVKAAKPNLTRMVERPITWDDKVYVSFTPDAGVVLTS
ncbi:ABC transporter ATP-binding protein [Ancylobacter dichloromethanicus]|uniref:Spermidine/putrescine import ATP-binding protein PotA n=1 Tax=Ancylobacter dichloromethanicus TaxID=518825 RepID=A0A9W6N0Y5_9HYPH|nr:ABC transporter ATP-binding protein [Ancylobacter dichloromethanicus]MBS7556717.1 ABC transporter ATP-binding protein [Ancylobacter dichloromethanicus]GLK73570.1 polyamine-transporting ATPase [Ancylobacter dichloromethanicus]